MDKIDESKLADYEVPKSFPARMLDVLKCCWRWCCCCCCSCDIPGTVKMLAGNTVPNGWLLCDGRKVHIHSYPALYSAIGARYGAVDNSVKKGTFHLPNLVHRFPRGVSDNSVSSPDAAYGGSDKYQMGTANLPRHVHALSQTIAATAPTTNSAGGHTHPQTNYEIDHLSHTHSCGNLTTGDLDGAHSHTVNTASYPAEAGALMPFAVANSAPSSSQVLPQASTDGTHTHAVSGSTDGAVFSATTPPSIAIRDSVDEGAHIHTVTGTTDPTGEDPAAAIDTVPAYTTLLFVIKT
ncbi:MAG: phage tail protein [Elusimicrobiota bacterium]